MLIIRLQRVGRKNDPSFRLVVTDSRRAPKSGAYVEVLGSYNARQKKIALKQDRIKHWLSCGAKTSASAHSLLAKGEVLTKPMEGV